MMNNFTNLRNRKNRDIEIHINGSTLWLDHWNNIRIRQTTSKNSLYSHSKIAKAFKLEKCVGI